MKERPIYPIRPHSGYGRAAIVTLAVTVLCAYLSWVHHLLYEADFLRFHWAYWVRLASFIAGLSGAMLLAFLTHVQLLATWTLLRIRRHGIGSLDKHMTISIHNPNNTINED